MNWLDYLVGAAFLLGGLGAAAALSGLGVCIWAEILGSPLCDLH